MDKSPKQGYTYTELFAAVADFPDGPYVSHTVENCFSVFQYQKPHLGCRSSVCERKLQPCSRHSR